jgi:hypothetical protein
MTAGKLTIGNSYIPGGLANGKTFRIFARFDSNAVIARRKRTVENITIIRRIRI